MGFLSTLRMYQRFVTGLPGYLRRPPITLDEAREALLRGLADRTDHFLYIARHAIYDNPTSPCAFKVRAFSTVKLLR